MDDKRTSYPYHGYAITTLQEDGVWWAKARMAEKDAGGDRPVLGGPWRSQPEAKVAAEAFCNRPSVLVRYSASPLRNTRKGRRVELSRGTRVAERDEWLGSTGSVVPQKECHALEGVSSLRLR
jgi:hypothetical protein